MALKFGFGTVASATWLLLIFYALIGHPTGPRQP
jgi:hypothetical protein